MALRKRPLAAGISALFFSGYVAALGLGEISLNSALNEPLDAEIPLLNLEEMSEEEILAGLASTDDFKNAGVDRDLILNGLQFQLDLANPAGPVIRVTSQRPIREPYLDFLVDVQWPSGRLLREYTLLLDLPVYAGGTFSKKKPRTATTASSRSLTSAVSTPAGASLSRVPAVAGDGEYVVEQGDTLWGISNRLPGEASIGQKMAAIHELNPSAFINNDINLIKEGAVLRLPEYGSMASSSRRSSRAENEPSYGAQLSGSSRDYNSPQSVDDRGRLSLSAGAEGDAQANALGGAGSGSALVRGEIASIQEELDRSRRENVDLRERLSNLESQLGTIQKILELEDDNLRAAQLASLQTELNQPASSEVESIQDSNLSNGENFPEEDSPSLALFPSANERRAALGGSTPDDSISATEERASVEVTDNLDTQDQAADVVMDETPAPQAESQAPAPMTMELKSEKGWAEKVSSYLIGLLVVAIAAIVFVVLRRRSKSEDYDSFDDISTPVAPPPTSPVRAVERPVVDEPEATSIDEIDLRDEDDLFAEPEPASVPAARATSYEATETSTDDLDRELSEVDLEEFSLPEEAPERPAQAQEIDDLNLDEEFDFLGDVDEGDTQLELAQAYLEMGDQGGAREILMEVVEDGTDAQKAKARSMLESLG